MARLLWAVSSSVRTWRNHVPRAHLFSAGLGAGVTEAVVVVTPMEVVKIRLQAQSHSLADPLEVPRYRNAAHAAYQIVREEGFSALYRGVTLTALRQATNQGISPRS
jgi:solute carrier family 25 citrate transporter 1